MIDSPFYCRAHGKLLLTGEYYVLDGALALAVPTRLGQTFSVRPSDGPAGTIEWLSLDHMGRPWFRCTLRLRDESDSGFDIESSGKSEISDRLVQMIETAAELCDSIRDRLPVKVETSLEFPREWGLGSSSTLIYCLAKWLGIDPFLLLARTFGGSGYDIACAGAGGPLFYRLDDAIPAITPVRLKWPFSENLYFVYLENKQDSREGIHYYRTHSLGRSQDCVDRVSGFGRALTEAKELSEFMTLLDEHEAFIAKMLEMPRVKEGRFPDFNGSVKSLGAWGGDFALAATEDAPSAVKAYFKERGYQTVIPWKDLVLDWKDHESKPL